MQQIAEITLEYSIMIHDDAMDISTSFFLNLKFPFQPKKLLFLTYITKPEALNRLTSNFSTFLRTVIQCVKMTKNIP